MASFLQWRSMVIGLDLGIRFKSFLLLQNNLSSVDVNFDSVSSQRSGKNQDGWIINAFARNKRS